MTADEALARQIERWLNEGGHDLDESDVRIPAPRELARGGELGLGGDRAKGRPVAKRDHGA